MSKEEALRKIENLESILTAIEKKEKLSDTKVEKLDVSSFNKLICSYE